LKASLERIRAARDHMDAMDSRDIRVSITQNDLTRSPRIPLASSTQTPGPLKPALDDVIARADMETIGPRQKVETLQRHRKGFWATLAETMRTVFLRGGWQFNSESTIVKSWQAYYEAALDVPVADADAFKGMEPEWLTLQTAWFDMTIVDLEI